MAESMKLEECANVGGIIFKFTFPDTMNFHKTNFKTKNGKG